MNHYFSLRSCITVVIPLDNGVYGEELVSGGIIKLDSETSPWSIFISINTNSSSDLYFPSSNLQLITYKDFIKVEMALLFSASKLMSFATILAILLLLMSSKLGSEAQPDIKLGMSSYLICRI